MNDTRFESCIKCTVCTTVCPVSGVDPRYPGPKQAGPDGERLRLKDGALYDEALKYCINCKRCEVACPSDVKIGDIIQRARARYSTQKPTLRDAILSHTDLMGSLSTPFAPVVNAATALKAWCADCWMRRSKSTITAVCRNILMAPSAAGINPWRQNRRSSLSRSPSSTAAT